MMDVLGAVITTSAGVYLLAIGEMGAGILFFAFTLGLLLLIAYLARSE